MYLGIDIGGTFTDLVLMDEGGTISTAKAPTTPGELEKGVFDAVAVAAQVHGLGAEELLGRVTAFGHGTTQATNALIERTGATTGLITTRGYRSRPDLHLCTPMDSGLCRRAKRSSAIWPDHYQ